MPVVIDKRLITKKGERAKRREVIKLIKWKIMVLATVDSTINVSLTLNLANIQKRF
jgi:hypothetical protein